MSSQAVLPSFVIIGAMRSGTTSLASWLREHPDVHMPAQKELHYFDRQYELGIDWYADQFKGALGEPAIGEATPNYLYEATALERLAHDIPAARVILLLRDPVARAHSHYLHRYARGGETLSFDDALRAEPERLASDDPVVRAHYSYADRGRYLEQIRRVERLFPAEQISIHLFEDLRDRPSTIFRMVSDFLGIDSSVPPAVVGRQANAYQQFRSLALRRATSSWPKPLRDLLGRLNRVPPARYPDVSAAALERLNELYTPERAALAELLRRDLHEWA